MEEVLAKYFSGDATTEEASQVESWRSESDTNAKAFFDAKSAWIATSPDIEAPAGVLSSILDQPQAKQVPFMMRTWVRYASAAVLVLALSLIFILRPAEESVFTPMELSDGSEVLLHDDATLEVIAYDASIREVRVVGKAYFDVSRDENRPFIIHADNAKVKVLGTSFIVDSDPNETEVIVESGLVEVVKVMNGNEGVKVKLAKGESGLVSKNNVGIIKKNNSDVNYLAWKTKVITFDGASMKEVKEVLQDVYGIEVDFENPAFNECKLTAKLKNKKAKDAIEIIARTFGVDYSFSKDQVILKGKGC